MANFNLTAVPTFPEGETVGLYETFRWGGRTPTADPPPGGPAVVEELMGPNGVLFEDVPDGDYFAGADVGGGVWRYVRVKADPEATTVVSGVTQEQLDAEIAARIAGDQDEATARGNADTTEVNARAEADTTEAEARAVQVGAEEARAEGAEAALAAVDAAHAALTWAAHGGLEDWQEFEVEKYGVHPSNTAAANDAAMAALLVLVDPDTAAAYNRACFTFGRGIYQFSAEIIPSGSRNLHFKGQGMSATRLQWTTDLGAGKYGIKWNSTSQLHRTISDMTITGPAGAAPADATAVLTADFVLGTDTVMHLADTSGLDAAPSRVGMVGRTKQVFYTGKTGTTLTGCTSSATPATYPSGGIVTQKRDLGYQPAAMDGLRWGGFITLTRVRIEGFRYAWVSVGDHNYATECQFLDNYCGGFYANTTATGDQTFINCLFTGNRLAGIAMDSGLVSGAQATMGGVVFLSCHFGFGPYAIYKAATDAGAPAFMFNVTMIDCAFEQCGNGVLYDESPANATGAVIDGWVCINCTSNFPMEGNTYAIWGKPGDYLIQTGQIKKFQIFGEDWLVAGKLGVIKTQVAGGLSGFYQVGSEIISQLKSKAVPFCTGAPTTSMMENTNGGRLLLLKCLNAVTAGDLVQQATTGSNADAVEADTGGVIVGVALQDSPAGGQVIPVMVIGRTKINVVAAVAQARYLKPDAANGGKVVESTGWADGPLVGHSTLASAAGQVDSRVNFGY